MIQSWSPRTRKNETNVTLDTSWWYGQHYRFMNAPSFHSISTILSKSYYPSVLLIICIIDFLNVMINPGLDTTRCLRSKSGPQHFKIKTQGLMQTDPKDLDLDPMKKIRLEPWVIISRDTSCFHSISLKGTCDKRPN